VLNLLIANQTTIKQNLNQGRVRCLHKIVFRVSIAGNRVHTRTVQLFELSLP